MSGHFRVFRAFGSNRPVSPLATDVEHLLRATTTVPAPSELRARVLAAYDASGRTPRHAKWSIVGSPARLRLAGVAAAAAGLVLAVGMFREPAAPTASGWEQLHPGPSEVAKVRVVDDPRLDGIAAASMSMSPLDPLQGP